MKNRLLSAISLLIVAVMLASAFVGCNKTADAGVDATEQSTSAPLENPKMKILASSDGRYLCASHS